MTVERNNYYNYQKCISYYSLAEEINKDVTHPA